MAAIARPRSASGPWGAASLSRRDCLKLLGGGLALGPCRGHAEEPEASSWAAWKRAFLADDGRVVDHLQDGVSHSEGQGYGMVLATAWGDEEAFVRMRDWTEAHLAVRRDPLLTWRWRPGEAPEARDYNNASDGDLFYAWSLLRGARRFGTDLVRAREVAQALVSICVVEDPRGGGRVLLLPGAERFRSDAGVIVNPSYLMPRALDELAAAFDQPRLAACARDGMRLLQEIAEAGPVPDWVEVTPQGWRPSRLHPPVSGYEALRVPLWLVWSDHAGHPAVLRAATSGTAEYVPVRSDLATGSVLESSDAAGYRAVQALARCASNYEPKAPPPYDFDQPYYPATIHLLAGTAAEETAITCEA